MTLRMHTTSALQVDFPAGVAIPSGSALPPMYFNPVLASAYQSAYFAALAAGLSVQQQQQAAAEAAGAGAAGAGAAGASSSSQASTSKEAAAAAAIGTLQPTYVPPMHMWQLSNPAMMQVQDSKSKHSLCPLLNHSSRINAGPLAQPECLNAGLHVA